MAVWHGVSFFLFFCFLLLRGTHQGEQQQGIVWGIPQSLHPLGMESGSHEQRGQEGEQDMDGDKGVASRHGGGVCVLCREYRWLPGGHCCGSGCVSNSTVFVVGRGTFQVPMLAGEETLHNNSRSGPISQDAHGGKRPESQAEVASKPKMQNRMDLDVTDELFASTLTLAMVLSAFCHAQRR